jgi:hypothetical protein
MRILVKVTGAGGDSKEICLHIRGRLAEWVQRDEEHFRTTSAGISLSGVPEQPTLRLLQAILFAVVLVSEDG